MKKIFLLALCIPLFIGCKKDTSETTVADTTSDTASKAVEIADDQYIEFGKKSIAAMTKGDIDSWLSGYSDNAKYYWNGGDSLIGKPAIEKFWKDRRANVIESISFKNDIWIPVKINKPQSVEQPGVWLMGWYEVTAKYKTGKSMTQWMHILYHFDANDKIDEVEHFVDRVPINAALGKS